MKMENSLYLKVGKHEEFKTIAEAVNAIPYNKKSVILIKNGVYNEKLFIEKKDVTIIGEDSSNTIITNSNGGKDTDSGGEILGTFRSYTAFLTADRVTLKNLTIANTAKLQHGQGIAAAIDAKMFYAENVRFLGWQDTLFIPPLPAKEFIKDGFKGPGKYRPRRHNFHHYQQCYIEGSIDFIFGGGTALFNSCQIKCLDAPALISEGYIAAPSTKKNKLGFLFLNCNIHGNSNQKERFYLARPWRSDGSAYFINSTIGDIIKSEKFAKWNNKKLPSFGIYPKGDESIYGYYLTDGEAYDLVTKFLNIFAKTLKTSETKWNIQD